MNAEDIAARFGVTSAVVRQRLKLAAVSPTLIQVYRDGDMNLDQRWSMPMMLLLN